MKSPVVSLYFFLSLFILGITFFKKKINLIFIPTRDGFGTLDNRCIYHNLSENYIHRLNCNSSIVKSQIPQRVKSTHAQGYFPLL